MRVPASPESIPTAYAYGFRLSPLSRLGRNDKLNGSFRRAIGLQRVTVRARFDLDEHVAVLPIAAVEKLVRNAGLAPDHLPRLFLRLADAAVVERHLVPAFRQRHDEVRQQMLVPWLTLARIQRHAPHPHEFVLEQDFVADWSQRTHRCSLLDVISHRLTPTFV